MSPDPIKYRTTGIAGIECVRPLWDQLNRHHHTRARAFRDHYEQWTFDDRKADFERIAAAGHLRIDLAMDAVSGKYVGYCIASVSQEKYGEIESVFIEEAYRSRGVGSALMKRALGWLTAQGSTRIRVSVADGNEDAFPFYRKFGFHPRLTVLEMRGD